MSAPAPEPRTDDRRRTAATRIMSAVGVALAVSLGAYLLMETSRPPQSGLVSIAFLLMLPAALSAFVAYVGDPWAERGFGFYLGVPLWLTGAALAAALLILHEGVVCALMLAPLWLALGWAGSFITRRVRKPRKRYSRVFGSALLVLPFVMMGIEPMLPMPADTATVTRSIVVDAPVERIWPLLRGITDVRPGEGRWNLTQDVIGVPRPLGARLVGEGIGAERLARWEHGIAFREQVIEWRPARAIGWRFIFDDTAAWGFTDRHLQPGSTYFRVTTGGYRLEPLSANRTRITLDTRYWMRTPVNAYSAAWGELFLGDLESNLLGLVKDRAEHGPPA